MKALKSRVSKVEHQAQAKNSGDAELLELLKEYENHQREFAELPAEEREKIDKAFNEEFTRWYNANVASLSDEEWRRIKNLPAEEQKEYWERAMEKWGC